MNDETICQGSTVSLNTLASFGTLTWRAHQEELAQTEVTPMETTTYTVVANHGVCPEKSDSVTLTVRQKSMISAMNDTLICLGSPVELKAVSQNTDFIQWYNIQGTILASTTVRPEVTTSYIVRGYQDICEEVSDTVTISVDTPASVTLMADSGLCEGEEITLTATQVSGQLQWFEKGDQPISDLHITAQNSTYYYATAQNGVCPTASDTVYLTVSPRLVLNMMNDTAICQGQAVVLEAEGTLPLTWYEADTITVLTDLRIAPAQTTTYIASTSNAYCGQLQKSVTITVHTLPAVSAMEDVAVCAGDSVWLEGSGEGSLTWKNLATDQVLSSLQVAPSQTTAYELTAASLYCGNLSDTVNVIVSPYPVMTIMNDTTICQKQPILLSAQSTGSMSWTVQGSAEVIDSLTVTPEDTTIYVVTSSINGCQSQLSTQINVVRPAVLTLSDQHICAGQSTTLAPDTLFGEITWYEKDTLTELSQLTFTLNATDTFVAVATHGEICPNEVKSMTIFVKQAPVFTKIMNDSLICVNSEITLTNEATAPIQWYFENQDSMLTDLTVVVSDTTNYIAIAENECAVV